MWIVIRGIRYNFNVLPFYYAEGSTVILLDPEADNDKRININCDSPLKANEIIEQIDNLTGAQTL